MIPSIALELDAPVLTPAGVPRLLRALDRMVRHLGVAGRTDPERILLGKERIGVELRLAASVLEQGRPLPRDRS